MTMPTLSTVKLVDLQPNVSWSRGEASGIGIHGICIITGAYAVRFNTPIAADPGAETMILCTPVVIDKQPFIHLAFGSNEHRVAHNISIDGLRLIVTNLTTILELAELEQPGDDACPSRKTK